MVQLSIPDETPLVRQPTVASLATVSENTFRKLVKEGRPGVPKPIRLSERIVRYRAEEVAEWLGIPTEQVLAAERRRAQLIPTNK